MSRLPRFSCPPELAGKLEPWFVEFSLYFRDVAKPPRLLRGAPKPSLRIGPPVVAHPNWPKTAGGMLDQMCQLPDSRITKAASAIKEKAPSGALAVNVDEPLLRVLSLVKYQTTFAELQYREKQSDRKASAKLVDILHLYDQWVHELLPPGGVRFKTNERHNLLLLWGLAGGLEKLTSSELVHFFDNVCPCGAEIHNQQVLQRLRAKLQKSLAWRDPTLTE
jgi:hypothetical protein